MMVIVCGLPGSGKTYFASRLATSMNAEYINSDGVRKHLGAMGRYTLNDKLFVYKEMLRLATGFLELGRDVVVDGTFYLDSMRDMFIATAKAIRSEICFIHIYADETIVKERLNKPRPDSEADFAVYQAIREEFETIGFPHLELESMNGNITPMMDQAKSYINALHEK